MPLGCPMVDFIIINSHLAKSSSQGCVIPDAIGNAIHCLFYSTNFLKCRVFTILPKDHVLSSFRRGGSGAGLGGGLYGRPPLGCVKIGCLPTEQGLRGRP